MSKAKKYSFPAFLTQVLVCLLIPVCISPVSAITSLSQKGVPTDLAKFDAAVLEENSAFITVMTESTVRSVAKSQAEILNRDEAGDKAFVTQHRNQNADYWYWAHQKARQALILALGRQPLEAVRVIDLVLYADHLLPQYSWVITPEFRSYLEAAQDDLAYIYDPVLGVEVFLTNYQVSRLKPEYTTVIPTQGENRGREIKPEIPVLEINLRQLVATPRQGESEKVGLDAFLKLPGGGVYDSLLPDSPEYKKRPKGIQEKLLTVSDGQLKIIPASSNEAQDYLQRVMSADPMYDRFLMIQGSMKQSAETTTFSPDLKIVVNPNSTLTRFLTLQRKAFASLKDQKAR